MQNCTISRNEGIHIPIELENVTKPQKALKVPHSRNYQTVPEGYDCRKSQRSSQGG